MLRRTATSLQRARALLILLLSLPAVGRAQQAPPGGAAVGTVAGTILDKTTGDPIIEAGVEVVGQGKTVRTDIDGRFSIKLPAGSYQLRIFAPLYQGTRLQNVTVKPGEVTKADAALAAAGKAGVEVVEVVAQASKASEATALLKRQQAAVVSDNVSAETIQKSPDSDAAEVVARVPAVTVKDDKYVFVRGLGERYSSAVLNGSRLPSPDPDKRVVPLDLFPSEFLDSLAIIKSYTPNLPGDFAGGLVDLNLREFPEKPTFNLGFSTGVNTASTFRRFLTYKGSTADYLGLGVKYRSLPPSVFGDEPTIGNPPGPQQSFFASHLKNIWDVESMIAPPNTGFNVSVGNSYGPFGFTLGGIYNTEYQRARNAHRRQFTNANTPDDPVIEEVDNFVYDADRFETKMGGVLTAGYKLGSNHKVTLRGLIDRNTFDDTEVGNGTTSNLPGAQVQTTRLVYNEQQLAFGQLAGEHHWQWVEMNWRSAYSLTSQHVPDQRSLDYTDGEFSSSDTGSGVRTFSDLRETLTDSQVDFTIPFLTALPFSDVWSGLPARFKFGPVYSFRDRDFDLRLFRYQAPGATNEQKAEPPEILFNPIDIDGTTTSFQEITEPRDLFKATEVITGGYGMFELPLVRNRLRLVGGVRVEYSEIVLDTADDQGNPQRITKINTDPLPGVNLIYSPRQDMNVRGSWSENVSRPEFRELTPTIIPPLRGERSLVGNPDLVESHIDNYDLRWEWFFSPSELVSLGGFYKKFDQPVEQIVLASASARLYSFKNEEEAKLEGFEFEGRKNFGFLSPRLANLSLVANASYISSNVTAPVAKTLEVQTTSDRPLQGQPPFVINAALEYTHPVWGTARLLYNTAGGQISTAGSDGLPDIVEERRDQLDAVLFVPLKPWGLPLTAKLGVENILNDPYVYTQGDVEQLRYTKGTKFTLGVSYSF